MKIKSILLVFMMVFVASMVSAAHVPNSTLEPEWSPADTIVNYDVDICNEPGSDSIDELVQHLNNYQAPDFKDKWYNVQAAEFRGE